MVRAFVSLGLCDDDPIPAGKKPKWNVDHLLDRDEVVLNGALVIRSKQRIEERLAQILARDQQTSIIEKGVGANDVPGNTHLLRVHGGSAWWAHLPYRAIALLQGAESLS